MLNSNCPTPNPQPPDISSDLQRSISVGLEYNLPVPGKPPTRRQSAGSSYMIELQLEPSHSRRPAAAVAFGPPLSIPLIETTWAFKEQLGAGWEIRVLIITDTDPVGSVS